MPNVSELVHAKPISGIEEIRWCGVQPGVPSAAPETTAAPEARSDELEHLVWRLHRLRQFVRLTQTQSEILLPIMWQQGDVRKP